MEYISCQTRERTTTVPLHDVWSAVRAYNQGTTSIAISGIDQSTIGESVAFHLVLCNRIT